MNNIKKKTVDIQVVLFFIFLIIIVSILMVSMNAEKFAPHDPLLVNYEAVLLPPCDEYPFGTDDFGRCILSRVLYGLQSSFMMSLAIVFACTIFGTLLGIIAGYYGKWVDELLMRITDMFLAFPGMVISIAIVGVLGVGWRNTAIALFAQGWVVYARLSRGFVLSIKTKDYMKSAKTAGLKTYQIFWRYVLPNMIQQIITVSAMEIGHMVISLCGLAYLGLGAQPPEPELGLMLNEAKSKMQIAPWMLLFPGFAVFIIVILFNLLSDLMRDIMDPTRERQM